MVCIRMKTLAMWTVWSQLIKHLYFVNVFQKSFHSNLLVFGFFIKKILKPNTSVTDGELGGCALTP